MEEVIFNMTFPMRNTKVDAYKLVQSFAMDMAVQFGAGPSTLTVPCLVFERLFFQLRDMNKDAYPAHSPSYDSITLNFPYGPCRVRLE